MEDTLVNYLINGAALGVSLFFIKKWIGQIDIDREKQDQTIAAQNQKLSDLELKNQGYSKDLCNKIVSLQDAHHKCRETLSDRFADKRDVSASISNLYNKLDEKLDKNSMVYHGKTN